MVNTLNTSNMSAETLISNISMRQKEDTFQNYSVELYSGLNLQTKLLNTFGYNKPVAKQSVTNPLQKKEYG